MGTFKLLHEFEYIVFIDLNTFIVIKTNWNTKNLILCGLQIIIIIN